MDVTVLATISSILATLLIIINIYNATVRKGQEAQQANARDAEKALNEFVVAYSGEYTELRMKVDALEKATVELKQENKYQNEAIDEIARDLLKHQLREEPKEVK